MKKVILEGRYNDNDEWGTVNDRFRDLAAYDLSAAIKEAERQAYEWWMNYPRMQVRVTVIDEKGNGNHRRFN